MEAYWKFRLVDPFTPTLMTTCGGLTSGEIGRRAVEAPGLTYDATVFLDAIGFFNYNFTAVKPQRLGQVKGRGHTPKLWIEARPGGGSPGGQCGPF